jgi:hypothetical protein
MTGIKQTDFLKCHRPACLNATIICQEKEVLRLNLYAVHYKQVYAFLKANSLKDLSQRILKIPPFCSKTIILLFV